MEFLLGLFHRLRFEAKYRFNPQWDTGIVPPELQNFVHSHSPGSALDFGCGTGTNSIYLAKNGWQVTGIDFVGKVIQIAREKARHAKVSVEFLQQDITSVKDFTKKFDLVLDIGCFHGLDIKQQKRYVNNLDVVMSPGATYLLYAILKLRGDQRVGLNEQSLAMLRQRLELISRQDGEDRNRSSAWFTFQRISSTHPHISENA